jgi:hypothetical protein
MEAAYSALVRPLENFPEPATIKTAFRSGRRITSENAICKGDFSRPLDVRQKSPLQKGKSFSGRSLAGPETAIQDAKLP